MESHDSGRNKVYINRNFHKVQQKSSAVNSVMHVNPKFSYLVSNVQGNIQGKNKIYVNPNFIKPSSASEISPSSSTKNNPDFGDKNNAISNLTSMTCHTKQRPIENNKNTVFQVPISQSRYCLVRQTVTNKVVKRPMPDKVKNTFKINKYKSVPWNEIKRNLDDTKNVSTNMNFAPHTDKNVNKSVIQKYTCFLASPRNTELSIPDRIGTTIYKYTNKNNNKPIVRSQSRVKKVKGNMKKNNLPCPLFRKFGICIRNLRDKCEFLHDKKHVSICRKFIKGLCHDKNCLLSHDLTTKKMPTCYFYLQGTCTKTDCPYLHVKLNENTKICPDFIKGYCEKGSKCLQRHINMHTEKRNKISTTLIRNSLSKSKDIKMGKHNIIRRERDERNVKIETAAKKYDISDVCGEGTSEYRYYQEHKVESAKECEIIKPIRCKLGALPSFIEL